MRLATSSRRGRAPAPDLKGIKDALMALMALNIVSRTCPDLKGIKTGQLGSALGAGWIEHLP